MNNNCCFNCGAKAEGGTWLTPISLDGSILDNAFGCDDCIAEERRVEQLANDLAAKPSCAVRQQIIDTADSVRRLVNRLGAHDLTNCHHCAAVRCDVCGASAPTMFYDGEYELRYCPACQIKRARIDAIVERHNAETARVA